MPVQAVSMGILDSLKYLDKSRFPVMIVKFIALCFGGMHELTYPFGY